MAFGEAFINGEMLEQHRYKRLRLNREAIVRQLNRTTFASVFPIPHEELCVYDATPRRRHKGFTSATYPPKIPPANHMDEHNTRLFTAKEEEEVNRGAYLERTPVSFARGPAPDFTRLCSTHTSKTCSIGTQQTGLSLVEHRAPRGHAFSSGISMTMAWLPARRKRRN